MLTTFQFFPHFLVLCCLIVVFIIVGRIFASLGNFRVKNYYQDLGFSVLIGYLVIVSGYAIIKSGGRTSFLIIGLLLVTIFVYNVPNLLKKKLSFSIFTNNDLKGFSALLPFVIVVFVFQSLIFYDFINSEYHSLGKDWHYYSNLGSVLYFFGMENGLVDWTNLVRFSLTPYHYADSWLVAFLLEFLDFRTSNIWGLIVNSFFYILSYIVGLAIIEQVRNLKWYDFIVAILFIIITPFFSVNMFFNINDTLACTLIQCPKYLIIIICYGVSFVFLLNNEWKKLSFSISILNVLYPTTLPSNLLLITGLSALLLFKRKINVKQAVIIITLNFFSSFGYLLMLSTYKDLGVVSNSTIVGTLNPINLIKDFFYICYYNAIVFFEIFPYLILLLVYLIKTEVSFKRIIQSEILFFFLLIIIGGIEGYSLNYKNTDSIQFYYNSAFSVIIVVVFYILMQFRELKLLNGYITVLFAILYLSVFINYLLNSFNKMEYYGKAFDSNTAHLIQKELKGYEDFFGFASMKDSSEYKTIYDKNYVNCRLKYISNFVNYYQPIDLSIVNMPETNVLSDKFIEEESIINKSPLINFIKSQKKENTFISNERSQLDFIVKNNIRFLEVSNKCILPKSIDSLILKSINDNTYDCRFIVLRPCN